MKFVIPVTEYLNFKLLFNCCAKNTARRDLQGVFWDSKRGRYVAADGWVLRVLPGSGPDKDLLILPENVPLTKAHLKGRDTVEVDVPESNLTDRGPYPDYNRFFQSALSGLEKSEKLGSLNLDLKLVVRFSKTMTPVKAAIPALFRFTRDDGPVVVFDTKTENCLGIIMPLKKGQKNEK